MDLLIQSAIEGRENAHCPYSGYRVGAALLTSTGEIINGCNVENASFGLTICAERTAMCSAICKGHRSFQTIVIITEDGKGSPCGACRQFLHEFAPDIEVIAADRDGKIIERISLAVLLPKAFRLRELRQEGNSPRESAEDTERKP